MNLPDGVASGTAWTVLAVLLGAVTVVDARSFRIPNRLNLALLVCGLAAALATPVPGLVDAVAGVALGGLFLAAVAAGFRRWRGIDGLGLGDVKFLGAAGAWVGWQGIGPLVFLAALSGLAWIGLRRGLGGTVDRTAPVPFGPHLCVALLLVRAWETVGPGP